MALTYSKVSVPEALIQRLQRLVEAHPEWGYRSASDAATQAIAHLADTLETRERDTWLPPDADTPAGGNTGAPPPRSAPKKPRGK